MTLTLMSSVIRWVLYILLTLLNLNTILTSFIVAIANISFKIFHAIRNPFNNTDAIALYEHIRFQDNKIAVIKSINEHYLNKFIVQ